jgi:hypothetical protein
VRVIVVMCLRYAGEAAASQHQACSARLTGRLGAQVTNCCVTLRSVAGARAGHVYTVVMTIHSLMQSSSQRDLAGRSSGCSAER